jgi:hypothetical protein
MISIPGKRPAAMTCMLALLTLGANSCGDHRVAGGGGSGATGSKQIKCDSDVDIDLAHPLKAVKKQAVYVCPGASFTWKVPPSHHFLVEFKGDSPFTNGSTFGDQPPNQPTGNTPTQYGELTVYKYSITVDSNPRVDPQVVSGGN